MLTHLSVKNYTVVENLDVDFQAGFTVVTGETGAGKSIVIDALLLALGGRGDTQAIRVGSDRCQITAQFHLKKHAAARAWLKEHDFDDEEECVITRSLNREGQSRSTISGQTCAQGLVREFAELLVSIQGQHEHQRLLKPERQRQYLDQFAGAEDVVEAVHAKFTEWQQIRTSLEAQKAAQANKAEQLALWQFQLDELEKAAPKPDEWESLHQENKKLQNGKQLIEQLQNLLATAGDDDASGALSRLSRAERAMEQLVSLDETLKNPMDLLSTAQIHLREAIDELRAYEHALDLNPKRAQAVEDRLNLLHELSRKHRVQPHELTDVLAKLQTQITALQNSEAEFNRLLEAEAKAIADYRVLAERLSAQRKKFGKTLGDKMTAQMQVLGMEGGVFAVQLDKIDSKEPAAWGLEQVSFSVSTNPGNPLQPLNKVVSGGELSRLGLALQVFISSKAAIPTLIFDEVDTGISGKTASLVADQLRSLGEKAQLMCITHLPQVAARGEHHFCVEKTKSAKSTISEMKLLTSKQRIDEIARMIGGSETTARARAHAEELLGIK